MVGSRLGSYDVQALAGRGGMGEVYRARDTRLKRTVALKILPTEFAQDPERLQRFQLEAEALAALNHPNIAAIHALEEDGATRFLVLEFVEGDTLADRLASGPIPLPDVSAIALQICGALSAAHDQGIVHRDLKPANIKITPGGQVKLLDFGLAKMLATDLGPRDLSHSPTAAVTSSDRGSILGTAAYMAPEQARGKPVDKRIDLWALGCVLYEMAAGQPVFGGETFTDVLAAVVTQPPDLDRLPEDTPAELRWVIERCLQKDPSARLRDAADAASALAVPMRSAKVGAPVRRIHWGLAAAAGAALAIAAAVAVGLLWRSTPAPLPVTRFEIPADNAPIAQFMAVSPDGGQIVFVGNAGPARIGLFVRSLDEPEVRPIPGTETARNTAMSPAWSPDGRTVAFVADGRLKTIQPSGGVAETLSPLDPVSGMAWNRDGVILFASNGYGLRRIAASGGAITEVTTRDAALDETYHDCPVFLPDGRHFLYLAYSRDTPENRAVYVGDLESTTRTRLVASDACVAYAEPGFLLMPRGETLYARPFDASSLTLTGDAVQIVSSVATCCGGEIAAFAVGGSGTLVYRTPAQPPARTLIWMDRTGRSSPVGNNPEVARTLGTPTVKLSPDGRRLVYSAAPDGGPDDIWTFDIGRNLQERLTRHPSVDHVPVWSPDGTRVIFDSHRGGKGSALYQIASNGATEEQLLLALDDSTDFIAAADWSRDGNTVLLHRSPTGQPPWAIWALPLTGDRRPFLYKQTSGADTVAARVSPNGRFVAYATNESGTYQVVVQPFPDPAGGRWQVSDTGGSLPVWRPDGRELFYLSLTGDLMAVPVTTGPSFTPGPATRLFRTPLTFAPQGALYDVDASGQRFLLAAPAATSTLPPISTILNWSALVAASSP